MTKEKMTLAEKMEAKTAELQEKKKNIKPTSRKTKVISFTVIGISALLVGAAIGASTEEPAPKPKPAIEQKVQLSWQDQIKQIAQSSGTPQEKFDKVMSVASTYQATAQDLTTFTKDITKDYHEGGLLTSFNDVPYTLSCFFKARVVDKNFEGTPQADYAFDYLQVKRDVFLGREEIGTDFVKANVEQMDESLAKFEN